MSTDTKPDSESRTPPWVIAMVVIAIFIAGGIIADLVHRGGGSHQDELTPGQKIISYLTQDVGGWCGYDTNAYATHYTDSWHAAGGQSVFAFDNTGHSIWVSIPAGTEPAQAQTWFNSHDHGLAMPHGTPVSVNCDAS